MKSKEDILNLMKSHVLVMRDRSSELSTDPKLKEKWLEEGRTITTDAPLLSHEELAWLNKEYSIWSQENIMKPLKTLIDKHLPPSKNIEDNA